MGPLLLKDPEEWSADAENMISVATLTVFVRDEVTASGTFVCPTRVPDTEMVKDIVGAATPAGNVAKVNEPMPEAPGENDAREGSVSRLNTIVWSAEL